MLESCAQSSLVSRKYTEFWLGKYLEKTAWNHYASWKHSVPTIQGANALRFCSKIRKVLHGVGADGVGVKFAIFAVNCSRLPLPSGRIREKRRKTKQKRRETKKSKQKKNRRKTKKRGKIPQTPSTSTPLRVCPKKVLRETKKSKQKETKKHTKKGGKIPPTPSTPTPLRASQKKC